MKPLQIVAVCHQCRVQHVCKPGSNEGSDFLHNHHNHDAELLARNIDGYGGNANVKQAFGTATAFTKTNANLATSATAGWKSNSIDNTGGLYVDALVSIELAAVNTAPANSKAVFLYAYSLIEGTAYSGSGAAAIDGTEGTLTFPDITTLQTPLPILGVVPYPTQNVAINSPAFSVARCFGGILPDKWGVAMVNHSGMTLSVTNIYYQELYYTVV